MSSLHLCSTQDAWRTHLRVIHRYDRDGVLLKDDRRTIAHFIRRVLNFDAVFAMLSNLVLQVF